MSVGCDAVRLSAGIRIDGRHRNGRLCLRVIVSDRMRLSRSWLGVSAGAAAAVPVAKERSGAAVCRHKQRTPTLVAAIVDGGQTARRMRLCRVCAPSLPPPLRPAAMVLSARRAGVLAVPACCTFVPPLALLRDSAAACRHMDALRRLRRLRPSPRGGRGAARRAG